MLEITSLRNGAVLNHNHGAETNDYLEIQLEGIADPQAKVTVCGKPAERRDRVFRAPVRLDKKINEITVESRSKFGVVRHTVTVVWDKKSFKRFNFFIDDNIFFLTDTAKERPRSLFDHFYLRKLRETHRRHGAKFTLNCFHRNDHSPFELKDFPDTYKSEWRGNADWLRLSFHAYSEFPDRPYQHAEKEKLAADFDLVRNEIVRFAGEDAYIPPVVIHWAMVHPEAFQLLRERGVRVLSGGFISSRTRVGEKPPETPVTDIGYFYERDVAHYVADAREFYDSDHGMTLTRGAVCCNLDTEEEIISKLKAADASPSKCETLGLATHEQYSFKYYHNYIPDHFERIDTACRTAKELGYSPVFFADGLLGNTAWGN
jgi:hypothetical protein